MKKLGVEAVCIYTTFSPIPHIFQTTSVLTAVKRGKRQFKSLSRSCFFFFFLSCSGSHGLGENFFSIPSNCSTILALNSPKFTAGLARKGSGTTLELQFLPGPSLFETKKHSKLSSQKFQVFPLQKAPNSAYFALSHLVPEVGVDAKTNTNVRLWPVE